MEAVADAGPLIHLAEIGRLSLFDIFEKVHIPNAVWQETIGQQRVAQQDLEQSMRFVRHGIPQQAIRKFIETEALTHLHAGEKEALYLCSTNATLTILTDDLAVRTSAKHLKIQPVGSLGIVVRTYRQQQLSLAEARAMLEALYATSSLFVTRTIVDLAIEQLEQRSAKS